MDVESRRLLPSAPVPVHAVVDNSLGKCLISCVPVIPTYAFIFLCKSSSFHFLSKLLKQKKKLVGFGYLALINRTNRLKNNWIMCFF